MAMQKQATETSDERLIELLRARGHRITSQRLVIHRLLREQDRHLTAEQVREAVAGSLPGVSTPTVYATLDLLADLGLVRRLHAGAGATLYDSRTDAHHHAACRVCGRVEDIDRVEDLSPVVRAARRRGFESEHVEVVVSGLCGDCASRGAA
jgi:Fe2+ or Zn2+ uptake regulation protein